MMVCQNENKKETEDDEDFFPIFLDNLRDEQTSPFTLKD